MRKLLQRIFNSLIIRLSNKYSSKPDRRRVHTALNALLLNIKKWPNKRGPILNLNAENSFVIFSDQHKGTKNNADDFKLAEANYLEALDYYNSENYHFINLGDSEELWKNQIFPVISHNKASFEKERVFVKRNAYTKVFGNHDLYWDNDPLASFQLKHIYGTAIPIYEGVILRSTVENEIFDIFLTHGHQGDLQSDGNWFSKWFVSNIWGSIQGYLQINPNTPAYDNQLKSKHNALMYTWVASKKNTFLITGHTHQPVFASLTHLERLYLKLRMARSSNLKNEMDALSKDINRRISKGDKTPRFRNYKPFYFNTGCCCYNDGDITGIEISDSEIRLIKWSFLKEGSPKRSVLERASFKALLANNLNAIF